MASFPKMPFESGGSLVFPSAPSEAAPLPLSLALVSCLDDARKNTGCYVINRAAVSARYRGRMVPFLGHIRSSVTVHHTGYLAVGTSRNR